jgi:hypothetical protein
MARENPTQGRPGPLFFVTKTLYIHTVFGYHLPPTNPNDMTMDANEHDWIFQCAERLHEQWPRVDLTDLEHLARALLAEDRWRRLAPMEAATQWLQQGIPDTASRASP